MSGLSSQDELDRALGRALVDCGQLQAAEYDEARTEQMVAGGTLALNLWELGLAGIDALSERAAELLRLPALRYADGKGIQPVALERLERSFVRRSGLLPVAIEGRTLRVASAEPWRLDILDEAAARAGLRVEPCFVCDVGLFHLLRLHYEIVPPPRYRARPMLRTRLPSGRAPESDTVEELAPELTSEEEFLRLYAGDAHREGPDRAPSAAPGLALDVWEPAAGVSAGEDDDEELVLSDLIEGEPTSQQDLGRAPIASVSQALQELERARDRAELGSVLVRFGLSFAPRVALFTWCRGAWLGWTGAGEGLDPERVAGMLVPAVEGTAFGLLQKSGAPLLGPLSPHPVHRAFCSAVGTRPGSAVGLFPVHHRGRVLFVLYLDAGSQPMLQVADVLILAQRVPATLERMVARSLAEPL